MLYFIRNHLENMESNPEVKDRETAIIALRQLGLNDFAEVLWSVPLKEFPKLTELLPIITPAKIQKQWTGGDTFNIRLHGISFVRSVVENYMHLTGQHVANQKILDFGCGYGRFLRMFEYYTNNVIGVDPQEVSLDFCRDAGYGDRVFLSDALPESLPVDKDFDLAFAFSVFSHLDDHASRICLSALAKHTKPHGILCLTIRPVEIWQVYARTGNASLQKPHQHYMDQHFKTGFAFDKRANADDGMGKHYGTSSMTLEWLQENAPDWNLVAQDRASRDHMQRYIFLQRK